MEREREFIRWLNAKDRSRQRLTTEKGQVKRFVVQYEAYIEGKWRAIVRYDTAHGYFHRDLIYPDGSTQKTKLPAVSFAEAFTKSELDIKINWRRYRQNYLEDLEEMEE